MLRSWQTKIWLEEGTQGTFHGRLLNQLLKDIHEGRLPPGAKLPGSRTLASQLKVNRKTVQGVYHELEAQGWLMTKPGSGTFVSDVLPEQALSQSHQLLVESGNKTKLTSPLIENLYHSALLASDPMVNTNDGTPDTRLIPYEVLARAYRRACIKLSRTAYLGYGDPRGSTELRGSIQKMLSADRFMQRDLKEVCLVRGSQMGIYLTARVLDPKQGAIVVEELCYPPARAVFESNGFEVIGCRINSGGLDIEHLTHILAQHRVAAVYVTPHHQYPTTVCLSIDRRLHLLALSRQYQFAVIEDDYDHEFHYEAVPVPPLASLPGAENVIHIGSLSKVFAPGLRAGYLAANQAFIDKVAQEIVLIDRQGNTVTEYALSDLIESGEVKKHIRKTLKLYRQRRDFAAAEFRRIFADKVSFGIPTGGMALWIDISAMSWSQATEEVLKNDPTLGRLYSSTHEEVTHLRFGYGAIDM